MDLIIGKKSKFNFLLLLFFLSFLNIIHINCDTQSENTPKNFQPYKECPIDKPVYKPLSGECLMEYCTYDQYKNLECNITNPTIKTQFINEFLYGTEKSFPIYSSFGTNDLGEAFFENNMGLPLSQKTIYTLKSDGREYIDGIKKNTINSGNNMYSKFGNGAIVTINEHKCYMKFSANQSLEFFDFDDKHYTFANLREKLGGYEILSEKNTLIRTNVDNTFIYAFITTGNYLMMIKFKVISNDANNCLQIIKTLKEDVKSIPSNIRTCMITKNQYIECLDINENQMYVIRIYNSDLKFLKEYELEKNNAPLERDIYHECVFLKDEISIFVYYNDIEANNAKPIMVLKRLTVRSNTVTLSNLNSYLTRDIVFKNMELQFSPTENSLAIFNSYYFGVTSLAMKNNQQHLIVALSNIFNDDKTIDTHYFSIPLTGLYDVNYRSGLRSFGFKNGYGVQMNFLHNNIPTSGFIVFGYGNTTDPEPINNLFDKYDSYTIKLKDFYKGIENNLFCYVFLYIEVTKIPSSTYFSVKTATSKVLKVGSTLTLDDEIIITKVKGKTPPKGRYVLGLAPYLNEADYEGFTACSVDRDMFGAQVPTNWYPDEFWGRTIEFKFTVGIDCHENCLTCNEKGNDLNDQKCTSCKSGYFFMDNTNNCFGEIPEGYYLDETKKTYMECFESCKACTKKKEGNNHNCLVCKENYILFNNSNCINCKNENKYFNSEQNECIDIIPNGYFINNNIYNTLAKCYEKCKTCNEPSTSEENMKCLSCDDEKGLYLKEGTNNCISEIKEGEYLDNEDKIIKKCNIACKTCSEKEILNSDGDVINCDSCNINGGFYLIDGTNICTNKSIEMNVKESEDKEEENEETEKKEKENTDIEDTEYKESEKEKSDEPKKCHKNCLTCFDSPSNDEEMNCLTCDNNKGYYFLEGKNNCLTLPYPGYYLKDNNLKKCYKDCLTCSEGPIANEKGTMINMNCDICDESKGLYLVNGTKNCEIKEDPDITITICPRNKPILKNGKCVLEYCSKEQYDNGDCSIANPIIKIQEINNFQTLGESEQPIYTTMAKTENDLIFEGNIGSPYSERNLYFLDGNSRGYYEGIPDKVFNLESDLFSTHGNGALFNISDHKTFMKLSYYETIEIYDFKEDKYTIAKLEDKLGYKVESSKNSLLETNEENTFIYAYVTVGNHLIMTKFKIVSNDANNCMEIIKTSLEDFITVPTSSRRCIITPYQYIECLDIDENKNYVVRIYDSDLNFLKQYELDTINIPTERIYDLYHEAIWFKENITIFVYYNDTLDNSAKPIIAIKKLEFESNSEILKKLEEYDDIIETINLLTLMEKRKLYNDINDILDYKISEIENSLAIINEHLFILASLTADDDKHLLMAYMNALNNYTNLIVKYYDIALKDLYDIDYYGNLKSFGFKNIFGVQFDQRKGTKYKSGFMIFSMANSIDPDLIENIFEKIDSYTMNPSEYIKIQNNIFCQKLKNIVINGIPDESSGVKVRRNDENKTVLKNGDSLNINEEIIITYDKDIIDKSNYDYNINFTPILINDDSIDCTIYEEIIGENKTKPPDSEEYKGRTFNFQFTVDNCYKNCLTCRTIGTSIEDQKCEKCRDNYYFVEETKNCYQKGHPPVGYYFDEKEKNFKKCYKNCKTCNEKGTSEYDMKCTSCDNYEGYYFFSGTKNCIKMPIPGYYINKEDNKIKKCDIACATCSYEAIRNENNEVTNCDTCNKDYGFYNLEGSTICINKTKKGEYYDESCKCYKQCYKDCLTCSGDAIDQYNMNCLTCDSSKGYQFFEQNSNCLNCKYLNKIVNYDQRECIDKLPEGYYINDTDKNTIDKCHPNCIKCSGPPTKQGNVETENCITCQHSLYLKNGNCIKTYTCPYNFFYQGKIDKYADINQKICLDKDEACPCALPFIYTGSNECVETCPLDLIFYEGCKISNIDYGLSKMINLIELSFLQGITNSLSKSFALSNINNAVDALIKITIEKLKNKLNIARRRLQYSQSYNYTKINITEDFESSDIDFGECELKLREFYNIPDDITLNLIKLEIKTNNSIVNHVQYEIFNPYNKSEKLDLSICQEEKIKLINSINPTLNIKRLTNIIKSSSIDENILSSNSQFYNDYCLSFISEEGADVLIQDRKKDYNYKGLLCQPGCEINDINITANLVSCLCPPNEGLGNISILNLEQIYQEALINAKNDMVLNSNETFENEKYSSNNFKAFKCIKNIFTSKFSKNYILIILTILILIFFLMMVIFFIYRKNKLKSNKSNPPKNSLERDIISSKVSLKEKKKNKYKDDIQETSQRDISDIKEIKKKSFYQIFIYIIKERILIVQCFYRKNKNLYLNIMLLIFSIINFIGINSFFFSEKNIHQIYLDKNGYNFIYQFKYIFLSSFICYIINIIISVKKILDKINNRTTYIILFSLLSIILLFYWFYVGAITSLFISIKRHLLINTIISLLFEICLEVILIVILTTIKYFRIKKRKLRI